ncbi:hypothetical protein M5D96_011683 [Drosophila gunungcola]|uniref:Uncharacterized protein n=1 Tax=Drosophila gunungcola TaxID=103775 RepID=A0A9P9YEN9_9MUSC|nr:hypothetical protein M5D96_011683 [Drosophila gunungcola]
MYIMLVIKLISQGFSTLPVCNLCLSFPHSIVVNQFPLHPKMSGTLAFSSFRLRHFIAFIFPCPDPRRCHKLHKPGTNEPYTGRRTKDEGGAWQDGHTPMRIHNLNNSQKCTYIA